MSPLLSTENDDSLKDSYLHQEPENPCHIKTCGKEMEKKFQRKHIMFQTWGLLPSHIDWTRGSEHINLKGLLETRVVLEEALCVHLLQYWLLSWLAAILRIPLKGSSNVRRGFMGMDDILSLFLVVSGKLVLGESLPHANSKALCTVLWLCVPIILAYIESKISCYRDLSKNGRKIFGKDFQFHWKAMGHHLGGYFESF